MPEDGESEDEGEVEGEEMEGVEGSEAVEEEGGGDGGKIVGQGQGTGTFSSFADDDISESNLPGYQSEDDEVGPSPTNPEDVIEIQV